jgi:hypothetical protein
MRLKSTRPVVIAMLAISVVLPKCLAQGIHSCKNGSCGSPLAGPCVPARVTYGHVPTNWRRWPTDHAVAEKKAPEELPTPATRPDPEAESMPEPETPDMVLPGAREPSGAATESPAKAADDGSLTPPFGDTPTPAFGDEPPAFGDEPQAPPSAADPLAVPFGDEPPTPPTDAPLGLPPTREPVPTAPGDTATPSTEKTTPSPDKDGPPAMPEDDLFKDDPFKDDPEPKTEAAPGSGARSGGSYSALQSVDATTVREQVATSASPYASPSDSTVSTSQPRLLQANGERLTPTRIPEPSTTDGTNPLRQVSHPVRKTMFGTEAGVESQAMQSTSAVWRNNPLRGK